MKFFHFFSIHHLLVILMIIVSHATGQTPSISVTPNQVKIGSNLTATCHVTINHAIAFEVNGNQVGSCPIPVGGLKDCSPKEIEQDAGLQQTTWTLPASTVYEGNWSCSRSTTGSSNQVEIQMFDCLDSVLSENGINSDVALNDTSRVNITVETGCIYPSGNPEIKLQFKSSSKQLNSTMNCNAAGTSCTEGTSYKCNHQIFFEMLLTNNWEFEFGINYTLHIQVFPSIGDCNSVAIFDQYSLKFISTGTSQPIPTPTEETTKHTFNECLFDENMTEIACYFSYASVVVGIVAVFTSLYFLLKHHTQKAEESKYTASSENVNPSNQQINKETHSVHYATTMEENVPYETDVQDTYYRHNINVT